MSGFLGIGGNGPDKQKESAAQSSLTNVFNYGLGTGSGQQTKGQTDINYAQDYWKKLLAPGRTQTALDAAPAVNAAVAGGDAARAQQAQFGTGRSGGTAAGNQQAQAKTQSDIDSLINENMGAGKKQAAAGLAATGGTELQNALALLGIGTDAEGKVLGSAQADRSGVRDAQTQIWSQVIKGLL